MEKKNYMMPEIEFVELELEGVILTGSDGDEIPQGGGEGEVTPGDW